MTTEKDKEQPFLSRWSRLKKEAKHQPPAQEAPKQTPDPKLPAPELPPLDKLTIDSDFRAFFHPKVGEDVRRAALKKLFSDPRFNVMDGLDVYIDDYSKSEPIPPAMLAGLRQAQSILAWAKEDREQRLREEALKKPQDPTLGPPAKQTTPAVEPPEAPGAVSGAPGDTSAPLKS